METGTLAALLPIKESRGEDGRSITDLDRPMSGEEEIVPLDLTRDPTRESGKEEDMVIYLSLLLAIIGLVLYFISSNPKIQETGRLTFAVGLLAFLVKVPEHLVNLLGK